MMRVTVDTVSIERIREFLQAAELLADNELDMIFPNAEWSVYASGIEKDLRQLLYWREVKAMDGVKHRWGSVL